MSISAAVRAPGAARWIVTCIVAVLFVARRPASFFAPQFWAEDGTVFYSGEVVHGVRTLFQPYAGYLHVVPRLTSIVAAHVPALYAPAVFALVAFVGAVWACSLFADVRYRSLVSSDGLRYLACVAFAVVPSAHELIGTIANLHSYLVLGVFLLLSGGGGEADSHRRIRIVLGSIAALFCVFSAPEAAILIPFAIWTAVRAYDVLQRLIPLCVLFAATIQLIVLSANRSDGPASNAPLGDAVFPTVVAFLHRVVIGTIGGDAASALVSRLNAEGFAVILLIVVTIILTLVLQREPGVRAGILSLLAGCFVLIWLAIHGRGLVSFFPSLGNIAFGGERYFFLPDCAFILIIAIALDRWSSPARVALFAALFICGAINNFQPGALGDQHWAQYAPAVDAWIRAERDGSPNPGVDAPINPPGWSVGLPVR